MMKPILLLGFLCSSLSGNALELEVHAGDFLRIDSIVTIEKPNPFPPDSVLESSDGTMIPLQATDDGKLIFNLPRLEPGKKITYRLTSKRPDPKETVHAEKEGDQIKFHADNQPIVTYQAAAKTSPRENLSPNFLRGGYLHPLLTPAGKSVTGDYPSSHPHHHGIWTAWTRVNYNGRDTDFWNMGQGKGKVDFVSLEKTWSGSVQAGLISHHKSTDFTSGKPVDALAEKWTVKVHIPAKDSHRIDLEVAQSIIGSEPLKLPAYHYGGLGIRGLDAWDGKNNANFLNSEGQTDRVRANGKTARWIRISGKTGNEQGTLAILSHPENFRSPQPIRINPTEPFISFAPQIGGDMEIKSGEVYQMKYRFIAADGVADAELLDRLWNDYAHPATAVWK